MNPIGRRGFFVVLVSLLIPRPKSDAVTIVIAGPVYGYEAFSERVQRAHKIVEL